jgi:hypothetical protein
MTRIYLNSNRRFSAYLQSINANLVKIAIISATAMPVMHTEVWSYTAYAGETCTYTLKGKIKYQFDCRWMINGSTKNTIFVDNNETGDRYEVGQYNYKIGPTSNCISKYAVTICTKQWW